MNTNSTLQSGIDKKSRGVADCHEQSTLEQISIDSAQVDEEVIAAQEYEPDVAVTVEPQPAIHVLWHRVPRTRHTALPYKAGYHLQDAVR